MFKVWAISLCHNDPSIIEDSMAQYAKTKSPEVETVHVFVDQHWPVQNAEFAARIRKLASTIRGSIVLDPGRNLGLHDGFNWAMNQLQIPDNAGVIGYDPDSWPVTPGWDLAMCRVFTMTPSVAWLSLWTPHTAREIEERKSKKWERKIGGVRALAVKAPHLNSVCMFRRGWLREVGGLSEPTAFYGGLECAMFPKLGENEWVFLPDFKEELQFQDRVNPLYREWKWHHAITGEAPMSFEAWINSRRK